MGEKLIRKLVKMVENWLEMVKNNSSKSLAKIHQKWRKMCQKCVKIQQKLIQIGGNDCLVFIEVLGQRGMEKRFKTDRETLPYLLCRVLYAGGNAVVIQIESKKK